MTPLVLTVLTAAPFLHLRPLGEETPVKTVPIPHCPEVVRRGDGPIQMLIVPAMSARWKVWEAFLERNAERYTMVAVTSPGFGGSPAPELPRGSLGTPWSDHAVAALETVIRDEKLSDLTVVGHSWGAGIAMQLAARLPDEIVAVINVDGLITSDPSREGSTLAERAAAGDENVIQAWSAKFDDPEEWARFNGWSENPNLNKRKLLVHGSNMATPKHVVLECWREMWMWDLNPIVRDLDVPLLDMRALKPNDLTPEETRASYLERLERIGVPASHRTVFFYDTNHAVEGHRPAAFDEVLWSFLHGDEIRDQRFD